MKNIFFDIECYSNYFLVCFKSDKAHRYYELYDGNSLDISTIKDIMVNYTCIGFNSNHYDVPMLTYALGGASNLQLKSLSDAIINLSENDNIYKLLRQHNIYKNKSWDTVDIKDLLGREKNNKYLSLKIYGARIHCEKLQELPLNPSKIINSEDRKVLREYCLNDIVITELLYKEVEGEIEVRKTLSRRFGLDMRSYSRARCAETAFKLNLDGIILPPLEERRIIYNPPSYIRFNSKVLSSLFDNILNLEYVVGCNGKFENSKESYFNVSIDDSTYKVGIGGLHLNKKNYSVIADENEFIVDVDVTSFYPKLILNNGYTPSHLGDKFKVLYQEFYNYRLLAKSDNDNLKSEAYKIILNSSYGKFGSSTSILYSPDLLLHTTLTGQLSLLMLIEQLGFYGFDVVSANTDGVTLKGLNKDLDKLKYVLLAWEMHCGFDLTHQYFKSIYYQSCGSYVGFKSDGGYKGKGVFAGAALDKNPDSWVCKKAVINYLEGGVDIVDTIFSKDNLKTDFLTVRKVNGGGVFRGEDLGSTVRWYYGKHEDCIRNKVNGNKVASSDGATPLMNLSTEFHDLDYQKYVDESYKLLKTIGVEL